MKSRARYSLVAAGIVAFIVITPFLYLFIRGEKYDSQNHRFIQTGTISVVTDPKKAEIFLNGEIRGKSNKSIRFLTPGDYNVEIKKDGYFTWSKRLNVREQYVSSVNEGLQNLTLFYSQPKQNDVSSGVTNFYAGEKRLVYTTKNKVYIGDPASPKDASAIDLPKSFNALAILPSEDENYFLVYNANFYSVLDAATKTLTDITSLLNNNDSGLTAYFSGENNIYELADGIIYKIDWRNNKKESFLRNVLTFYPNGRGIYYISALEASSGYNRDLLYIPFVTNTPQTLIANLPTFHEAKVYLTDRNQLFIDGDSTLYAISSEGLSRIADYIDNVYIDNKNDDVLYSTSNEIDLYDITDGTTSFVTRTGQQIQNPIPTTDLGWVFFQSDNRIQNIETDNRDHQNNYTFATVGPNAKYWVNSTAENMLILDEGKLTQLNIR